MLAKAPQSPLPAYRRPAAEVVEGLGSDAARGLSSSEIAERLRRHGRNALPAPPPVRSGGVSSRSSATRSRCCCWAPPWSRWSPGGSSASRRSRTRRSPSSPSSSSTACRVRAGHVRPERARAAGRRAAAGAHRGGGASDILLIEEGDTIPADAWVLESVALRAAESALTGESTPVSKDGEPLAGEAGIGDQSDMLFAGTAISSGRGRAVVTGTGSSTEIGKIARSLQACVAVASSVLWAMELKKLIARAR